ncbi:hypothetical protein ACFWIN_05920 [Streptomyces sp. NPDC127049]|uniref:hypothetical protein n=1 Tax=Streptomyces TaxID=1883 RepID=UPI00366230CB
MNKTAKRALATTLTTACILGATVGAATAASADPSTIHDVSNELPENFGLPAQGADATNLDKTVLNVANKFLENNNPMGSPQPKGSSTFTLGSVSDLSKGLDITDIPKGVPSLSAH